VLSPTERISVVPFNNNAIKKIDVLPDERMNPLFMAVVEATEEAIYNSLFMATTVKGKDGHISEAIPIKKTVEILKKVSFF
jgi:D-aminopeptidase